MQEGQSQKSVRALGKSPFSHHQPVSEEDSRGKWQRPAPLKVESGHYDEHVPHGHTEYWAHEAEGFHVPLTTPQITTVRSIQEDLFPGSHADATARQLQQLSDGSFRAPHNTPQVQQVRAAQEKEWVRTPPAKPTIERLRSQEEDIFRGSNDLSAQLVAAAAVLPAPVLAAATSVPVLGTVPSVATFGRSASMGLHAHLPMPRNTHQQPPHAATSPAARTAVRVPPPVAEAHAVQRPGAGSSLPPTPVSSMSAVGASVWGATASALHTQLSAAATHDTHADRPATQHAGSGLTGTTSHGAHDTSQALLQRAAAIAAVRRQEEDEVFRKPAAGPVIDAIRAAEEQHWYRVPANSPQIAAVRAQMAGFKSEPVTPQLEGVRSQLGAFATGKLLPPAAAVLRTALNDPLAAYKPPPPFDPHLDTAGGSAYGGVGAAGWHEHASATPA